MTLPRLHRLAVALALAGALAAPGLRAQTAGPAMAPAAPEAASAVAAAPAGGVASAPAASAPAGRNGPRRSSADPWEPWNRKVYAFNDAVDRAVLAPVARAYVDVIPSPVRTGVSNFFGNFGDAWSTLNLMLQGKPALGVQMGMRVLVNTFLGLGGLLDIATEARLERHSEDLGQTLGVWGVPAGPYVVWPLLGPSTLRDSAAMPADRGWSPARYAETQNGQVGLVALGVIDTRASLLGASRVMDDIALDRYSFLRDAFLARRQNLVYDGDPPEPPQEPEEEPASTTSTPDQAPAPASAPAPAPASAPAASSVPPPAAPASAPAPAR